MTTLEAIRAALPAYPIEVSFPDINRWREGNTGIDFLHSFDSGKPGKHVMILALTHGNEVSGAIAVDALLAAGVRPTTGRLSLGFGNIGAYEQFSAENADATRFLDEDMNRVWTPSTLDGERQSRELARARAMRPFIDTVDLLLDIHSMHEASAPLMMTGPLEKAIALAAELGTPEHVIIDKGHANGTRMRDYGGFGDPASPKNALLIETGQHFAKSARDVALDSAARFLLHAGVVAEADVAPFLTQTLPARQKFVEITQPVVARSMDFRFSQPFTGLEVIEKAGTEIARDGDEVIVTPYDNCVIVQPSMRHLGVNVTMMRLGRLLDR
ncbi:M14 family metallopeptidase [Pandoraea apista]|uniref:Succinylglutamate desuccinylase n=1 Tax=Pandoraea apista TaxID=93218 RepID=A0ABX9ZSD3_9BURK|nr:M14 family metallopeptidase [Pandoraea apista]AJE98757.1 succinylglutamate desuccinylase [Pandoraea apista]AKH72832.1 succinylglutamate desuccinylase [Pandoraea apista]AKI61218.1 succinylglutamate desuccinylase [Pandoraea apista]AVF39424.1 succinylglutamate desuccinylase [Pandoraea apista]PTD99714.1 succinylglutamate desuccinylase [Pandoraea apista]